MKLILILLFLPALSYAQVPPVSCENNAADPAINHPEQLKTYYCELNFRCTIVAINTDDINWDVVDQRRKYSLDNNCNDELKLAAWMTEIAKDPPELHARTEPQINQSERSEGKDLPVIPDAPAGARSHSEISPQ